jgi:hypothetical protein
VDWLVPDRLVDPEELVVTDVVGDLLAVAIALVTALARSAWLLASACSSRWICCCVGAVASALKQALIAASDGPVGVPVGAVVAVPVGVVVVVVVAGVGTGATDGKNGAHCARAAEVRPRSAVTMAWALDAFFCARARPWAAPAPDPVPDGLPARELVVVAEAALVGALVGVVVVVVLPVVLAVVEVLAALWSDSKAALAWASAAWAAVTALRRGLGSRVARTCPLLTVSPTETNTLEMVPDTAKPWVVWLTG